MSRKGKSHEINDIIDTAFTETDYSHGNGYYDEIRDYRRSKNTNSFRNLPQNQTPVTPVDTKLEKNMFLKYSQNDTTIKNNDTQIDKQADKEIVVNEDNFPSLGGGKPKVTAIHQPACLNFKKVVTTTLTVPTENMNTKEKSPSRNPYNKPSRYLMYHHIKDNSEKIARYKMENEYSSDNDDY